MSLMTVVFKVTSHLLAFYSASSPQMAAEAPSLPPPPATNHLVSADVAADVFLITPVTYLKYFRRSTNHREPYPSLLSPHN